MSSVRRSSRLAADSSTPKITSYGSVKRVTKNRDRTPGFDKTEFESPKVLTLQTPKNKVETPKFIFETPKKKLTPKTVAEVPSTARRRILRDEDAAQSNKTTPKKVKRRLDPDSPPKVFSSSSNESVVNSEISSTSDPYSPPRTPKKRIIVETPESNSSKLSFTEETADANKSPGLPIGLTTPKSARRRLFADEESPSSKCDLFFSTFQSNTPASTRSGLGSISRTGESGQYSRLAPQVKEAMNIPLPQKYQTLFDTFEMMERI
uniref:Uncharacterized protein n=1 Tax=Panagrolaimus sp. JU765 TaxID=591449 RepID=A0AC34Q6L8_9BILA